MVADKVSDISSGQYGDALPYDPEFRGPIKGRSCTDIICLLLFLVFLVGWGVVAGFAATSGDPSRLLYPTDSFGRVCGKDPGLEDKKFLFFFDLTKCASPKVIATGCPTPQVCVEKCPSKNWFYVSGTADKKDLICKDTVNITQMDADKLVSEGHCARYYVESDDQIACPVEPRNKTMTSECGKGRCDFPREGSYRPSRRVSRQNRVLPPRTHTHNESNHDDAAPRGPLRSGPGIRGHRAPPCALRPRDLRQVPRPRPAHARLLSPARRLLQVLRVFGRPRLRGELPARPRVGRPAPRVQLARRR